MPLLKGLIKTLQVSPILAVKEAARRATGRPYAYRGIEISDEHEFRVLRRLLVEGRKLWSENGTVYMETGFGTLAAPSITMLAPVSEVERLYGVLDVEDRAVLDIGAFIADSSLFFASRGARKVYAYEPVFYEIAMRNVELNKASHIVEVISLGVGPSRGRVCAAINGSSTGLVPGNICFNTIALSEVLTRHRPGVVKVDCEGCEYAILCTPCSVLEIAEEWLVEVHGSATYIVSAMERCGFRYRVIARHGELVELVVFSR